MAKSQPKLVLDPARDIPLDRIVLSQANVRRLKNGVSIEVLADDIARRGLLQSLSVRPELDAEGEETGRYEAPAGGRRYRALQLLVKRRRLAKDAPVPCVVKPAGAPVSAEEDSLAENSFRERLHPLDEFRAMQRLIGKGDDVETVAAVFGTTAAVVRQRLKLASVSPRLHEAYAGEEMTLDQLIAFAVCDDHARQEQLFEQLAHCPNPSPAWIRARLTEASVQAFDRRVRFIGIEAYLDAGGGIMRDLFVEDGGGWLTDVELLDRLVDEKLKGEGERIAAEGWKWVTVIPQLAYGFDHGLRPIDGVEADLSEVERARADALPDEIEALSAECEDEGEPPAEVAAKLAALEEELDGLVDRPLRYDPREVAIAGAFVALDRAGRLIVERGYVRSEDEPARDVPPWEDGDAADGADGEVRMTGQPGRDGERPSEDGPADDGQQVAKPLPDRLVAELTAERTVALQDALARDAATAFLAVLHKLVLSTFFLASRESCLGVRLDRPSFACQPPGLADSAPARAIAERHAAWRERLPGSDEALWDALQQLDSAEQATLFAHCASFGVNAQWEPAPKYDNGRVSAHAVERRIAHADLLARAVSLDMVAAGWKASVDNYLGRVTKQKIVEAVAEAKGSDTAALIDHLKKADMAREAERLLDDSGWLPEPLRPADSPAGEAFFDEVDHAPGMTEETVAIAAE